MKKFVAMFAVSVALLAAAGIAGGYFDGYVAVPTGYFDG